MWCDSVHACLLTDYSNVKLSYWSTSDNEHARCLSMCVTIRSVVQI